ncbi:cytosine-specific methyltransferase [Ruminococcus sp. CAG:579]|nr:cytosine-specific methyltransferase [Ruminococcus sp. CAG:579]
MIKYFDIFAGIGGFRSGLEKAGGFECVGYCEIDRYAQKAYETMYDTEGEVYGRFSRYQRRIGTNRGRRNEYVNVTVKLRKLGRFLLRKGTW